MMGRRRWTADPDDARMVRLTGQLLRLHCLPECEHQPFGLARRDHPEALCGSIERIEDRAVGTCRASESGALSQERLRLQQVP